MPRTPLYEQLASEILEQIRAGTFQPGERLPSVRQVSQQKSLSVTTGRSPPAVRLLRPRPPAGPGRAPA